MEGFCDFNVIELKCGIKVRIFEREEIINQVEFLIDCWSFLILVL